MDEKKQKALYYSDSGPISREDIEKALMQAGLEKGDIVMVHSDIRSFGRMGDIKDKEEFVGTVLDAFLNVLGGEGTLVVPTYTYSFCKNEDFDVKNSPSTVGTFSEFVRKDERSIRSEDPLFSHAAIGKDAGKLLSKVPDECFGKDSFFDRLYRCDGKIINFGKFFDITYIHYIEKNFSTRYRYDKKFSGTLIKEDGSRVQKEVTYYVRYYLQGVPEEKQPVKHDCSPIEKELDRKGLLNKVPLGDDFVICSQAKDCYDAGLDILKENEFVLVLDQETTKRMSIAGEDLYNLIKKLYPICRSITGNGVRETLKIIQEHIPIEIHEVPTGTKVFDWTVPKEWNIKDAYIKNSRDEKIVDFQESNLHVLNYSVPVNKKVPLEELKKHLFTLPEHPDWIPYRTTYYEENWGFCMTHRQLEQLEDEIYEVVIDSSLEDGHLTYGELFIEGETSEEVLLSCYLCHPSLCNDNLSGVGLLTFLAKHLLREKLKYSYRFLFIPETIGAITWLSINDDRINNIKHGLVATCLGDSGKSTYKKSRIGNAEIDCVVEKVLMDSGEPYEIIDFYPFGSDERQFCSPGFNLPVGSLMRTPYDRFPEYHNSADNLDFVGREYLSDSFNKYLETIFVLENNETYMNLNPKCEPQLGKRGIYRMLGGQRVGDIEICSLWVLNLSDGSNSLLDISIKSDLKFRQIVNGVDILMQKGLLKIVT